VTEAKPDSQVALANAVKGEGNGASAPPQPSHDHAQAPGNAQPAPVITDPNAQLAAVPQQLSAAAPTAASDKFSVTQATGAAVPVSGLAVEIAATAQSGKTHFEVRLDPADLGRIDVRIDVDRNGQVTSHLTVEKPETLSMLRQDAPQLQQALNDAGLKTGSGGLQFSLRDQSQSGQNNPNNNQTGGQPQRLVVNEEDTIPAAIAGRSYGRMLGASGGVDIRV
jgi:flagellar hook-length control protein FliK